MIPFEQTLLDTGGNSPDMPWAAVAGGAGGTLGRREQSQAPSSRGSWAPAVGTRPVRLPDVLQRVALVDDDPTRRAGVVLLQILDQAAPADCLQKHILIRKLTQHHAASPTSGRGMCQATRLPRGAPASPPGSQRWAQGQGEQRLA